jgi:electron transfer flavoprotein beta subunit
VGVPGGWARSRVQADVRIAVCWKWLSLDGEVDTDSRWAGVSRADEAALEVALRLQGETQAAGGEVTVVCLGPADAEPTLRAAFAAGAQRVVRVDASPELDSLVVATALAEHTRDADLVVCGDYSLDRGTGSVPAFLAAEVGAAQALGLVEVDSFETGEPTETLRVLRRLDGGRREVLDVPTPAVISVEGAVARLRRAPLSASLASRSADVTVLPGPFGRLPESEVHPYRPRPRRLPAPEGDALARIYDLLDVGGSEGTTETLVLQPSDAAAKIVEQLREWGYLADPEIPTP